MKRRGVDYAGPGFRYAASGMTQNGEAEATGGN